METKTVCSSLLFLAATAVMPAFAQAPTALTVKAATSKRVDLTWSGAAASYTVQRRILGGAYSNIASTVTTASYSDTTIDAFTTYQYQIVANLASGASSPSNQVTVGPPPAGFTNAAAAPGPPGGPASQDYGYNLSLILDGNGDPAFAFIFYDPNQDGDPSDTRVEFRSWNRALYKWNDVVHVVSNIGDVGSSFRQVLSLAYDAGSNTFGIATENNNGTLVLYLSADGGTTWTRKMTFTSASGSVLSPSLAFTGGAIHLAYAIESVGLKYVTGKLTADPTTWTTKSEVKVAGVDIAESSATVSLALDSNGAPAIAWWAGSLTNTYNRILQFWKPLGAAAPVKIMDSQNRQSDEVAVKLVFYNLNPRVLANVVRNDSVDLDTNDHSAKSDDGGSTWSTPVMLPADGDRSTDYPFDLAVDSHGIGAAQIGSNGGSNGGVCGNPKFSRTTDFVSWKTCDVANNLAATQNYSVYPGAAQVLFGGNDRLYFLWWDQDGIDMYREPPAGAVTGPSISSVVNGATFQAGIVPGSWTTITGANLSGVTRSWGDSDFNNGNILPTNLSGVSVKIGGLDAPVYYISPTQLNVQAPANISGNVNVVVTNNGVASAAFSANTVASAPGLFTYSLGGRTYPSALYNGTYAIVGDPALYGAAAMAKAGDIIQLYGTGLGPSPAGNIISSPITFSSTVTATVGTANTAVLGTALVAVGEFQINIQVPSGLADGTYQLLIKVNGVPCQTGIVIPITH